MLAKLAATARGIRNPVSTISHTLMESMPRLKLKPTSFKANELAV